MTLSATTWAGSSGHSPSLAHSRVFEPTDSEKHARSAELVGAT
jgi:hypothetical protein